MKFIFENSSLLLLFYLAPLTGFYLDLVLTKKTKLRLLLVFFILLIPDFLGYRYPGPLISQLLAVTFTSFLYSLASSKIPSPVLKALVALFFSAILLCFLLYRITIFENQSG